MNSCNTQIDPFQRVEADLEVSEKFITLMQNCLDEDSIYMRAKDTYSVVFKDLQITEKEKADIIAGSVNSMVASLSGAAMQTALSWAKEERDGGYTLAKVKAETETAIANALKVEEEICLAQAQTAKVCADITAVVSGSYRDNGMPTGYDADGCRPTGLDDTGLKYHQARQAEADAYSRYADAYRKSGIVVVGDDTTDGVTKGLSGDEDGYTWQQQENAERLRISYEDSKRSNAASSASSMIASMLSSEIAPNEADVNRWRDAVDFLNTSDPSTARL